MERRRRIEIFFVLYIAALAGFVVVSRERDKHDRRIEEETGAFLASFLQPVQAHAATDTIRFFVEADSTGFIRSGMPQSFDLFVPDIEPEDSVSVSVSTLAYRAKYVSPGPVSVGPRLAAGELRDRTVRVPVTCGMTRTGTYDVQFGVNTKRVHELGADSLRYRSRVFRATTTMRALVDRVEHTHRMLTIVVEDTTARTQRGIVPLRLRAVRDLIETAAGFEEQMVLTANDAEAAPMLRIVRGGGGLTPLGTNDRGETSWMWRAVAAESPDTITVEARVRRGGGSLDIARTTFAVTPRTPLLQHPLPQCAYAGERLECDLRVQGLGDAARYSWDLYQVVPSGESVRRRSGTGPFVSDGIPNNFAGAAMRVVMRYDGRPYRYVDPRTDAGGTSTFTIPVMDPPTRITFDPPAVARPGQVFEVRASMYSSTEFSTRRPLRTLGEIAIEMRREDGSPVRLRVWVTRPGVFQFEVDNQNVWSQGPMRVWIVVRANAAVERRSLILARR